jgi:hypothetical protein
MEIGKSLHRGHNEEPGGGLVYWGLCEIVYEHSVNEAPLSMGAL